MFTDPPPTWRSFWIFMGGIVTVLALVLAVGALYVRLSGPYESIRGWATPPLQPHHIEQLRAGTPFYLYDDETHVFIVAKRDVNTEALTALSDDRGFRLLPEAIQQIIADHGKSNRALFIASIHPARASVVPFPTDFDAQSGAVFAMPAISSTRRDDGGIHLTIAQQTQQPPKDSR